jgi:hypothetical protein
MRIGGSECRASDSEPSRIAKRIPHARRQPAAPWCPPLRDLCREIPALAIQPPTDTFLLMSAQAAFQRGVGPLLELLLPGREDAVLSAQTDLALRTRIEELASKNTEDTLTPEERDEYAGYVRANKFVAILRREAKKFKSGSAA